MIPVLVCLTYFYRVMNFWENIPKFCLTCLGSTLQSLSLSCNPSRTSMMIWVIQNEDDNEDEWFMFDECVGGCRGRLLIDIFDYIHCTRILHCLQWCLQCRCHILGSFAALSSLPPWWSVSVQGLQLTYAMYVASKLLWFPIGGPSHTSSGWLSVGLCSVSTLRQFSASLMKARRKVAVSVLGYLACVWHIRHSSAVTRQCVHQC